MPLAVAPRRGKEHVQRISELIINHDQNENKVDCFENLIPPSKASVVAEEEAAEESHIDESDLWLVKYDELAQKSKNIPLSHLGCCKEGGELFNDLCMWVDINQKYVDLGLFPQWDDIARELRIDDMKTEWVRVCVRPEQSFTRAILEIYMSDGGTLGDVIGALRKQKQYRIIQEISEQAEEFMDVYNTYHKNSYNPNSNTNVHVYSILKTLFETFNKMGHEDPLNKYQLYSGGFKSYLKSLNDKVHANETDLVVNAVHFNEATPFESHDSGYTSPHRYGGSLPSMTEANVQSKPISEIRNKKSKNIVLEVQDDKQFHTIRILLVFARDGAIHAEQIVTGMLNFSHEDFPTIRVDFFRLNEVELWNALLVNPEACLMKWIDEMDYVMPILTPDYLQDLHNPSIPPGPPGPTSAMINKYVYTLLRSEFVASGCQNFKVRPALPSEFVEQLCRCKPVQAEPLFKMWKHTDLQTMKSRLGAMIKIWAKKHDIH